MKVNAVISYTVVSVQLYITRNIMPCDPHCPPFRSAENNIFNFGLVIIRILNENINYK